MARRAARTDATQEAIVKGLRKCGIAVEFIGHPLDLLVCGGRPKRTMLIEVKTDEGTYTEAQKSFMARWPGEHHTVRTLEEALTAVLGKEAMQ